MGDLKAFVDSNVIINHLEGKLDLSELRSKYRLHSNAIVFSEVSMVYLKAIAFQSLQGLISTIYLCYWLGQECNAFNPLKV